MGRKLEFWTIDAETDPFGYRRDEGYIPQPFIWGAYNGDDYEEFESGADLIKFFERKRVLVYAHNGGKFDYHYLREFVNSDEPVMSINGRLAKFRVGECEFRDSLNLFPFTRLEDFGGKVEIDYDKMRPERRGAHMDEIRRYLRQDCVLLWDNLKRYFDTYGRSLTQAGSAMREWQRTSGLQVPKQTKAAHETYRPFYYGGRVQCFREGARTCNFGVWDVNSAYPRAMLEQHIFSTDARPIDHLPPEPEIFKCLIELDCTSRGAFPWRDEDGSLFFPDDEAGARNRMRTYKITGWEFLAALETDTVKNVNIRQVYEFPLTINFKDYIERFYNSRKEAKARGDKAGDLFGKYFMNGLYGKFGACPDKYREFVIASEDSYKDWVAAGFMLSKAWGTRFLMERPLPEIKQRYYNVATAASITGYQRAFLWKSLLKCGNPIYCDTDSIAAEDGSRLDQGSELGQWKLEMRGDFYAVAGKKLYAFHKEGSPMEYDEKVKEKERGWKIASKGVKLKPSEIIRVANGETIEYRPDVPCYSMTREVPRYINRQVMRTFRDLAVAGD